MASPVLTTSLMRQWEQATWATGKTESEVIERVGEIVARRALTMTKPGDLILILAGRGHNGDDARSTQPHLKDREVTLLNVTDPVAASTEFGQLTARRSNLIMDASWRYHQRTATPSPHAEGVGRGPGRGEFSNHLAHGPPHPDPLFPPREEREFDRLNRGGVVKIRPLIIDGLFGIGLNRPLDKQWTQFIEQINQTRIPILAVDLPSGLNADTGETFGAAVRATVTLTLGAIKTGLLGAAAWPFVGRLEVAQEIGLVPCPFESEMNWTLAEDFSDYPPRRAVAAHKGTFGHLAIVAGSVGYHGAAVLAARGAQRAQPGLVTLCVLENIYAPVAAQLQAVMVCPFVATPEIPDSCTAILCGPGLASPDLPASLKSHIVDLWQTSPLPMVVDASALDWLPAGATSSQALRVLTPHPGEAARLLKATTAQVQADRPTALRELSRRFGNCWVILKGHQTLIGRSEGKMFINSSGNPYQAQGGGGDVLAGFVGGLLAQPELHRDVEKVLRYAVWQHGTAADRLQESRSNWTVENLVMVLGSIGR